MRLSSKGFENETASEIGGTISYNHFQTSPGHAASPVNRTEDTSSREEPSAAPDIREEVPDDETTTETNTTVLMSSTDCEEAQGENKEVGSTRVFSLISISLSFSYFMLIL